MPILNVGDIVSGQLATATANIDGVVEELFYARTLEATMTKHKDALRVLGVRGDQHKSSGWEGTGSLTMYYTTSVFRRMAAEYARSGRDIYFNLTVTNEDPTTTIGRQTAVLLNCNLDSIVVAKFDTEANYLDEDMDFTFDDFYLVDEFGAPTT